MRMQWNYNYYCYYYFYHAWFEASVRPTIHKTVSAHSCKEAAAGMNSVFRKECRGTKEAKERWERKDRQGQGKRFYKCLTLTQKDSHPEPKMILLTLVGCP